MAVHPRVCGELGKGGWIRRAESGSSPRVRGTGKTGPSPMEIGRFIPACAGNWRRSARISGLGTVHPRVCGELSGWKILETNCFVTVKNRTGNILAEPDQDSGSRGANCTSVIPSKSTGVLRLWPVVRKAKP